MAKKPYDQSVHGIVSDNTPHEHTIKRPPIDCLTPKGLAGIGARVHVGGDPHILTKRTTTE